MALSVHRTVASNRLAQKKPPFLRVIKYDIRHLAVVIDSVASLVTAGTVPASGPLAPATGIPLLRHAQCSETVTSHAFLHHGFTPRRGVRTTRTLCYGRWDYRRLFASRFAPSMASMNSIDSDHHGMLSYFKGCKER